MNQEKWKKYKEDYLIGKEIGSELRRKIKDLYGNLDTAAKAFQDIVNLSDSTCLVEIGHYCGGTLAYKISSGSSNPHKYMHLERLSHFYKMLNIEENETIISLTRQINPFFQYPPDFTGKLEKIVGVNK
jgi:hypothetical protein